MPDGTRKRRFSSDQARRKWYALFRALRFSRRFFGDEVQILELQKTWVQSQLRISAR